MRPMPSPKGTNHARLFLPYSAMALDGAFQGPEFGSVADAIADDIKSLEGKIPPVLFEDVKVALADFYTTKVLDDLDRVDEAIEQQDITGLDRALRAKVDAGVARMRARDRQRAVEIFPGLLRIRQA